MTLLSALLLKGFTCKNKTALKVVSHFSLVLLFLFIIEACLNHDPLVTDDGHLFHPDRLSNDKKQKKRK